MDVEFVNPGYSWKNRDVLYVSITITAVFLIAMSVSLLSESTLHHNTTIAIAEAYAQPYVETVKNRNLTIDLGNGLMTKAQLTFPAIGKGPYPGVLIFPGAGAGSVITPSYGKAIYYGHLAEYLSERGFAVLRYLGHLILL